ncbi:hypothetical protein [Nocardioides sp. AE5]|uniref:hypothetical protein n=1 Tax=Nocardioides sp. AE5 TaxID=2962573 RepID=UPI002880E0CC|nr:hypothetical protein [Nocardioides sp. AE5]MDT0201195.1 hypothetical protein [Nocardioides sp. AE5]
MAGLLLVLAAVLLAVLFAVVGRDAEPLTDPRLSSPAGRQDLAAVALSGVVDGVRTGDAADFRAVATPEVAQRLSDNAQALHVADFSLRYVDEDRALSAGLQQGQWAAAVDASWRFDGFDPGPAWAEITVTFALEDGQARITGFGGGSRRTPLWLLAGLAVDRTDDALVMVAGESVGEYATQAREAVRVVRAMLPDTEQGLVVEVPANTGQLNAMLDADEGEYDNIAAVTTTVDGSLTPTSPVHVLVNPQLWSGLKAQGAQVVMSHEAVHVVTGAATTSGVPLWLLEGFADYVALRDVDLPLTTAAAQVIARVQEEGVPDALPGSVEFNSRTSHLGAAYEAAWLACRVLVGEGGEDALVDLYNDVSAGASLPDALQEHFGLTEDKLVGLWQDELEALAR